MLIKILRLKKSNLEMYWVVNWEVGWEADSFLNWRIQASIVVFVALGAYASHALVLGSVVKPIDVDIANIPKKLKKKKKV